MSGESAIGESATVVGLISDTHDLLRPEVFPALEGVSMILHAGDVGERDILTELGAIAPVYAVRGNTDPIDDPLMPAERDIVVGELRVHVSHGHELGSPRPPT